MPDKPRLALGRLGHTAVFEPDALPLEYAIFKGKQRRGKEWEAFKSAHPGMTIVKPDEYKIALKIRDAVREHEEAKLLLSAGIPEQVITWTDAGTGLQCKARPDWISAQGAIVDLKTTKDIDSRAFARTIGNLGYFCQAAMYQIGYAAANNGHVLPFLFVAVEIEPPYDVAVYELDEDSLYAGEREVMRLLALVNECERSGVWPGVAPKKQMIRIPAYSFGDDEEEFGVEATIVDEEEAA